jgi:hypothetical protein
MPTEKREREERPAHEAGKRGEERGRTARDETDAREDDGWSQPESSAQKDPTSREPET